MTQTTPTSVSEQHISRDRETIQKWADRHNAVSVRTSSDGSLNLIHESKVAAEHERLDWDTFYAELEDENHAVSYHGDGIEIPEVITQDKAISQSDVDDKQIRNRLVAGETVTNTIHETSAVETPVIEEATVESELVSREVIHDELLDVELVERTRTGFSIVPSDNLVDSDTFDRERYFASLEAARDESSQPDGESSGETSPSHRLRDQYQTQIDVREVWMPTRKITERFTIESRITGTDVAEADTLEDYDLDTEGLQRSIIEEGMLDAEDDPEEVKRDFEIESELSEGDQIHTHFTRTSVLEDEVINQIRVGSDIDRVDFVEMDFTASKHVVSQDATETMRSKADGISLTNDDLGKDVVDATGSIVGTLEDVTDGGQTVYVVPHSSVTEHIMSSLGWSDDDAAKEIHVGQFARINGEEVQLKENEQLAENRQATADD